MNWTPAKRILVDVAFGLGGLLARPVNRVQRACRGLRGAANRLLGRVLSAAGIRRDPGEGDDGTPR